MRGMTAGSVQVTSDGVVDGMIGGDVVIAPGIRAIIKGMVAGDVIVEAGAEVRISGMVAGRVVNRGGLVDVGGMVAG